MLPLSSLLSLFCGCAILWKWRIAASRAIERGVSDVRFFEDRDRCVCSSRPGWIRVSIINDSQLRLTNGALSLNRILWNVGLAIINTRQFLCQWSAGNGSQISTISAFRLIVWSLQQPDFCWRSTCPESLIRLGL